MPIPNRQDAKTPRNLRAFLGDLASWRLALSVSGGPLEARSSKLEALGSRPWRWRVGVAAEAGRIDEVEFPELPREVEGRAEADAAGGLLHAQALGLEQARAFADAQTVDEADHRLA